MLTQFVLLLALLTQPKLAIPAEIKPVQGYAEFYPDEKTTCKGITYLGRSGVYPVPSRALKDNRIFLLPVQGLAKGRYKFEAVGSLNDVHVVKEFEVVVGDAPGPPPGPDPPPGPTPPPKPDGRLGLIKASREGFAFVQGSTDAEKKIVASVHRTVASMIGTSPITSPDAILAEIATRRNRELGTSATKWSSFNKHVLERMKVVLGANLDDWRDGLREIAEGLE